MVVGLATRFPFHSHTSRVSIPVCAHAGRSSDLLRLATHATHATASRQTCPLGKIEAGNRDASALIQDTMWTIRIVRSVARTTPLRPGRASRVRSRASLSIPFTPTLPCGQRQGRQTGLRCAGDRWRTE